MTQTRRNSEIHFVSCNKSKKSGKSSNPHLPRPRNAFIMFRQYYHRSVQGEGPGQKNNSEVSKELGAKWRSLPTQEKCYWENLAGEERKLFAKKQEEFRSMNKQISTGSERNTFSVSKKIHPSPPILGTCDSIPPITNIAPSHIWFIPTQKTYPTCFRQHFGSVGPGTFQLPIPTPDQSQIHFPNHGNKPMQFPNSYPSPVTQQRLLFCNVTEQYHQQQLPGIHPLVHRQDQVHTQDLVQRQDQVHTQELVHRQDHVHKQDLATQLHPGIRYYYIPT